MWIWVLQRKTALIKKEYYQKESLTAYLRILTENVVVFSISYQDCLEKKTSQQIQKKIDMADFAKLKNI